MSCAVETAKGWALGMLAAAVALAVLALGIGLAIKVAYHDPHRICVKGHDADPSPGVESTYFVCDQWVPAVAPSPSPEATP